MSGKIENITTDGSNYNILGAPVIFKNAGKLLAETIASSSNVTIFKVEENFQALPAQKWFQDTQSHTFYWVGAYVLLIFGGQYLMKSRQRFELKNLLILWNFGLAAFSIMGAIRIIPEITDVFFNKENGYYHSVCNASFMDNKVFGYWIMLFGLSKIVELGDTIFIVLRKQQLIFLHWYHHVTVLVFSWSIIANGAAPGRWFSSINFFIHSMMYTYYGLRALKIHVPKRIAIAITSSQLIQMVVGVVVMWSAQSYKKSGLSCDVSDFNINFGLAIYASYWVLFANFFYKAYMAPKSNNKKPVNGIKKEN